MLREFNQQQMVELEGDEVIKNHFIKNGRLMQNIFNRFIKDLEQKYKHVEVIGKGGKKTRYIIGDKREEIVARKDKRKFNGAGQLPFDYEQGFPLMILEYLMRSSVGIPTTSNSLLNGMGFITDNLFNATKSKYSQNVLYSQIATLKESNIIEHQTESVVYDFIDREITRITKHFMSYLQKLEEAKLIIHNKHTMGIISVSELVETYNKSSGRMQTDLLEHQKYIELSSYVIDKIAKMKRELQNKPMFKNLTTKDIYRYRNKKLVKNYWKEHDKLLYQITDE